MPSSTLLNITETDCVHMFAAAVVRPIAVSLAKKTELIEMPFGGADLCGLEEPLLAPPGKYY